MIKVYLDWNVMSQMKNGYHNELKEILLNNPNYLIPFSTSHISDILSSYKETKEQKKIINNDLEFISSLTNELCLFNNGKGIRIDYYPPKELFEQSLEDKDIFSDISINGLINVFKEDKLANSLVSPIFEMLKNMPIEKTLLDAFENPESSAIMEKMFPGLKENPTMEGLFKGFSDFNLDLNEKDGYKELRKTIQNGTGINRDRIFNSENPYKIIKDNYKKFDNQLLPNNSNVENGKHAPKWFDEITNDYLHLDMHGYQEDNINIKKGRKETFKNTTEDAFHSAFASTCNFYVLNDNKSYKKTKKVYENLDINTYVFKPDEFLKYYNDFLKKEDYSKEIRIFTNILNSTNFLETKNENGHYKTYNIPFFLFDYFNRIVVFINSNNEETIFLSQNKPTNFFVNNLEFKKLVNRLINYLGLDDNKYGNLEYEELREKNWKGRIWSFDKLKLRLSFLNKYAQLYFDIEEPAGNKM